MVSPRAVRPPGRRCVPQRRDAHCGARRATDSSPRNSVANPGLPCKPHVTGSPLACYDARLGPPPAA